MEATIDWIWQHGRRLSNGKIAQNALRENKAPRPRSSGPFFMAMPAPIEEARDHEINGSQGTVQAPA